MCPMAAREARLPKRDGKRAVPARVVLPRYIAALIVSLVFAVMGSMTTLAQQSTLEQQLLEPDCGAGACEMTPPTIMSIEKNGSRPVITGTYDAAFTKQLRVIFGERVYTLGIDEQLVAVANEWQLNLSNLAQPLVVGAYELIVETEGYDGEVKRESIITIITEQDSEQESDSTPIRTLPARPSGNTPVADDPSAPDGSEQPSLDDPDDIPRPMSQEEVRAKVSFIPLVITLGSVIVLVAASAALTWPKNKN